MKKILVPIFLFLILLPVFIFSQEIEYPKVPEVATPTATTTFPEYVKYIFNFVVAISGLVALAVMVWGGILYLTSAGDPGQISEARNKILGALLGLIILLSSYLILWTINPQLTFLTLPPAGPTSGIYLKNAAGKKFYVADTTYELSFTDATQIEFISPTSSLLAVYIYNKKDLDRTGTEERIINQGAGSTSAISLSSTKSIYFLWNRPGVYLCPTTATVVLPGGETICSQRPLYTAVSIEDLGKFDFNDKAKSIQIINPAKGYYRLILFEDIKYTSKTKGCPFVIGTTTTIPDLNISYLGAYWDPTDPGKGGWYHNKPPLGQDTLSSLIISYLDPDKQISGKVTFYDETDCPLEAGSSREDPISGALYLAEDLSLLGWDNKIRSFMISGTAGVALATDKELKGRCRFFTRAAGTEYRVDDRGCITSLPTEICNPNKPVTCPSSFIILPLPE